MKVAACKSDMTTCGDGKVRTAVPIGTNRMYVPCVPQRAISDSKKSISSSIPVAMVVRPSPCLYHYKGKNRRALGHGKGVAFEVRTRAVRGLTFGRIVLQRGFHAARKRRWGSLAWVQAPTRCSIHLHVRATMHLVVVRYFGFLVTGWINSLSTLP
jgi:hypothetical protein